MFQLNMDKVVGIDIIGIELLTSLFFVVEIQKDSSGLPAGKMTGR